MEGGEVFQLIIIHSESPPAKRQASVKGEDSASPERKTTKRTTKTKAAAKGPSKAPAKKQQGASEE